MTWLANFIELEGLLLDFLYHFAKSCLKFEHLLHKERCSLCFFSHPLLKKMMRTTPPTSLTFGVQLGREGDFINCSSNAQKLMFRSPLR